MSRHVVRTGMPGRLSAQFSRCSGDLAPRSALFGWGLALRGGGGGDIDLAILADQNPGSAVTSVADCLQSPGDVGLLESRGGSGHVLQLAESAFFWSLALL